MIHYYVDTDTMNRCSWYNVNDIDSKFKVFDTLDFTTEIVNVSDLKKIDVNKFINLKSNRYGYYFWTSDIREHNEMFKFDIKNGFICYEKKELQIYFNGVSHSFKLVNVCDSNTIVIIDDKFIVDGSEYINQIIRFDRITKSGDNLKLVIYVSGLYIDVILNYTTNQLEVNTQKLCSVIDYFNSIYQDGLDMFYPQTVIDLMLSYGNREIAYKFIKCWLELSKDVLHKSIVTGSDLKCILKLCKKFNLECEFNSIIAKSVFIGGKLS